MNAISGFITDLITSDPRYLHQIWSEVVDDGTKGETIPPRSCHVIDFDSGIALGHFPTPQLQTLRSTSFAHLLQNKDHL